MIHHAESYAFKHSAAWGMLIDILSMRLCLVKNYSTTKIQLEKKSHHCLAFCKSSMTVEGSGVNLEFFTHFYYYLLTFYFIIPEKIFVTLRQLYLKKTLNFRDLRNCREGKVVPICSKISPLYLSSYHYMLPVSAFS